MLKKYLIVFFISMVPVVELRGAIPVAVGMGLPLLQSYITAVIGNMIPVPFIYFFARRLLMWGKDKKVIGRPFSWILEKGNRGGEKLMAIPLPGTGAWTGTLAASILNMGFKKSVIAVLLGVAMAGVIMGLASAGVFGAAHAIAG